jgi:UDP-GlcNAc:undecaprenyl-phosphate/decaprenyl-phosphate GlcNAc-1-phosphate transferase
MLWILAITNAFNLIDGLDGLAAGLAVIAATTCAIVLLARGERAGALLLVSLVGAIAGFLAYNFHPAKIFLGDSGSLLVGFLLAVTAITGQQKGATTLAVGVPLLIFALPLADISFAIVRRLFGSSSRSADGLTAGLRGLSVVFAPDRLHIHHRLLDRGLSHRGVVLLLYGLTLALSALALLTMQVP